MHHVIRSTFTLLVATISFSALAVENDPHADVVTMLVSSPHLDEVKLAAKVLYKHPLNDEQVLDVVAQRLSMEVATGIPDASIDTISWLAKSLGESGNARYRSVIENALWLDTNADHISKHFSNALSELGKPSEQQFVAKPISWASTLRDEIERKRTPESPSREELAAIEEGTSLVVIYRVLGVPVTVSQYLNRPSIFGKPTRVQNFQLDYGSAGVIQMRPDRGTWVAHLVLAHREDHELAEALRSDQVDSYRPAAEYLLSRRHFPAELMDIVGATAVREANPRFSQDREGLEALCNALAFGGEASNRFDLIRVANKTYDRNLKAIIGESIKARGYY